MSGEQTPEVAALRSALHLIDVEHPGYFNTIAISEPAEVPAAYLLLGVLKEAGWQLTRVGDEERLRAALEALAISWETSADAAGERTFMGDPVEALTRGRVLRFCAEKVRAALAPQPPLPASQGEER